MDRKEYNGLRGSGLQLPIGAQMSQQERQQAAFNQQHQAIAREIYVRAMADSLVGGEDRPTAEYGEWLSEQCQIQAAAYFAGLKAYVDRQERLQAEAAETPAAE